MTITRAQMEKQVKHGKKKPVMKAKMGKFLETVSPAYSIMKGKGPIGEAFGKAGKMGLGGIAGMIAAGQMGNKPKGSDAMKATGMQEMQKMYGGGAVKKKRDGCAMKGKTKGTIR